VDDWGLGQSPVQYGSGTSYQGSCPSFPAAPAGYVPWSVNLNGAIPAAVQARANALASDMTKALGYTETMYSGGVPLILRVDAHTWTTDSSGQVNPGCYHGVDVWVPAIGAAAPAPATQASTSNRFLAISIGIGAIASVLSIYEYFKNRA
jgi:hypothetical protein